MIYIIVKCFENVYCSLALSAYFFYQRVAMLQHFRPTLGLNPKHQLLFDFYLFIYLFTV